MSKHRGKRNKIKPQSRSRRTAKQDLQRRALIHLVPKAKPEPKAEEPRKVLTLSTADCIEVPSNPDTGATFTIDDMPLVCKGAARRQVGTYRKRLMSIWKPCQTGKRESFSIELPMKGGKIPAKTIRTLIEAAHKPKEVEGIRIADNPLAKPLRLYGGNLAYSAVPPPEPEIEMRHEWPETYWTEDFE